MQAGLGLTLMGAGGRRRGTGKCDGLRLARTVDPEFQGALIQLLERPGMTGPLVK